MCGKCAPFLKQAEAYCEKQGLRLTAPRAQVLGIMVESARPLTAYEILEQLGKTVRNPKPPTVYRALEFLQGAGLVHRVESLNAYLTCGGHDHGGADIQFLICDGCGDVREVDLPHVADNVARGATAVGFKASRSSTEVHGLCDGCSDESLRDK